MIVGNGELITGCDDLRGELQAFVDMKPRMKIDDVITVLDGDGHLATTGVRGRIMGRAPDGTAVTIDFCTREVSRRQPNGEWLVAIEDAHY